MTREPIVVGGQRIGRLRASYLLFKEAFRFLRADKEMLWLPVLSFCFLCVLIGLLCIPLVFGYLWFQESPYQKPLIYGGLFCFYVLAAFISSLSQAGIVYMVATRARGGDATLGQALGAAFAHTGPLFVWSCITSTVGIILRIIADRFEFIGQIVAAVLGAVWGILTYFVIQGIVLDGKSAPVAIGNSGRVFKKMWGEALVTNISLGLVFFIAHVVVLLGCIGLGVLTYLGTGEVIGIAFVTAFFLLWLIAAALVQAALDSILRTLLYMYASDAVTPINFNKELLEQMLVRSAAAVATQPPVTPTV